MSQMHLVVKPAMRNQLNKYYEWDNTLGRAWNRVQVKVSVKSQ